MNLRKYAWNKICKFFEQELMEEIVAERVRINNAVMERASIKPWQDGNKRIEIMSMNVEFLGNLICPELPAWFKPIKGMEHVVPSEHRAHKHLRAWAGEVKEAVSELNHKPSNVIDMEEFRPLPNKTSRGFIE